MYITNRPLPILTRENGVIVVVGLAETDVDSCPNTARQALGDAEARCARIADALLSGLDVEYRLGDETLTEAAENFSDLYVEIAERDLPLRAVAGSGPCPLVGETDHEAYAWLVADPADRALLVARGIIAEDGEILGDSWCAYAHHEVLDEDLDRHAAVVVYRSEVAS